MLNYIYPLALALMFWQCADTAAQLSDKEVPFGQTFLLGQHEQVKVVGEGEPLTLEFTAVTDSRCPKDVACVWAGNATVSLQASNAQEKAQELQLCLGDCRPDPFRSEHAITASVGGVAYLITLTEVRPYPGQEKNDVKKEAKLKVQLATE